MSDGAGSRRPRLAVLIPVFNAAAALDRTLESVDAQEADFDIVVVDDGSRPPLRLDPGRYRHRLTLLRQERNGGISAALNAGLRHALDAGYELVARQDAGDLDLPGRLAKQMAFLDRHPEVALVGGWVRQLDATGRNLFLLRYPAGGAALRRSMRYGPAFSHPACMFRVAALRAVGLYDPGLELAEDYELFCRLVAAFPCANIPEPLIAKLDGPGNVTWDRRFRSRSSRLRIQLRHFSAADPHAWLGVARSLIAYLLPPPLVRAARQWAGRAALPP